MKKPAPNQAVERLYLKHKGPRALARAADVSPGTAQKWVNGRTKPLDESRARIAEKLKIEAHLWDLAPLAGPEAEASDLPPLEPIDLAAPGAHRELILDLLRRAMAARERVRADPRSSQAAILKAEDDERKAVLAWAKVNGDFAPDEANKILRSTQWRRIRAAASKALLPWPDALAAFKGALCELGDVV